MSLATCGGRPVAGLGEALIDNLALVTLGDRSVPGAYPHRQHEFVRPVRSEVASIQDRTATPGSQPQGRAGPP